MVINTDVLDELIGKAQTAELGALAAGSLCQEAERLIEKERVRLLKQGGLLQTTAWVPTFSNGGKYLKAKKGLEDMPELKALLERGNSWGYDLALARKASEPYQKTGETSSYPSISLYENDGELSIGFDDHKSCIAFIKEWELTLELTGLDIKIAEAAMRLAQLQEVRVSWLS